MKPTKQEVYLPVIEDTNLAIIYFKTANGINLGNVKQSEGYFFTPEELNEYTANVIRQALETAVKEACALLQDHDGYTREWVGTDYHTNIDMSEGSPLQYGCSVIVSKESITNTFEEIFKEFEV